MPAIDVGLLIDLAALAVSTATTIAGTTPPSIATKESRGKVSKDLINRVRISDKSFVYATQALIVAYSLAHAQAIIRANGGLFVRSSLSKAPEIAKTAGTSFLQYLSRKAPGIVNAAHPSRAQAWLGDEHVRRMFRLSCLISAVGGVLRVVCFRTLGRFFTFDLAVHDNHKVIQTGPYALVRHPSYTAILLLAAGEIFSKTVYGPGLSATYRPTAWYIASAVSTIVLILVGLRIREEEKMLQAELGKEYKEYMNNVPARLIPYLM